MVEFKIHVFFSLFLLLSSSLLSSVVGDIAPKCRYAAGNESSLDVWISSPPLMVREREFQVYFCSSSAYSNNSRLHDYGFGRMVAAIRNDSTTVWNYTYVNLIHCFDSDYCYYRWRRTSGLMGQYVYQRLTPNSLYFMTFLTCYGFSCNIGSRRVLYQFNTSIATRPEMPSVRLEAGHFHVSLIFRYRYYTGPPPHGHETVLWKSRDGNLIRVATVYSPISQLTVSVHNLMSNTEYLVHIRANGSHRNPGAWVQNVVKTLPIAPNIPEVTICRRDTSVLLKLSSPNSSAVFDSSSMRYGVKDGGSLYEETLLKVTKDNVILLDGLRQRTAYVFQFSVSNTAGTSNFTEWIEFNTTSKVRASSKGDSIGLKWSPPDMLESDLITGYEASISAEEEKRVVNYLLSSDGREVTFEGLKSLTVYKVELVVRINSSSSGILQPFYSANLTTVEESNTEAVVSWVGGAGIMLAIVGVVIAIVVGGVLLGCCVKRKWKATVQNSEPNVDEIDMDHNPAYGDHEVKQVQGHYPDCAEVRYVTGNANNTTALPDQRMYEEVEFTCQ